jgi:hypothetical protein
VGLEALPGRLGLRHGWNDDFDADFVRPRHVHAQNAPQNEVSTLDGTGPIGVGVRRQEARVLQDADAPNVF